MMGENYKNKSILLQRKGITLIALILTIIVLLITLSIVVTLGIQGIGDTIEDKQKSELGIVQTAVMNQYYKYTVTKKISDLVGTQVQKTEINAIAQAMNITLSEIIGESAEYSYYRLTPTMLKEIGVKKAKDTYIVNYGTGEVINDTIKLTESGFALYMKGISAVDTGNL